MAKQTAGPHKIKTKKAGKGSKYSDRKCILGLEGYVRSSAPAMISIVPSVLTLRKCFNFCLVLELVDSTPIK